jgi:UPF0716 protein FxsA
VSRILIPLLLLGWPLAEIAGFVVVGRQIGVLATIGLVLAGVLVGSVLLRWQGLGVLTRVRREMDAGRDPSRDLAHGAMIMVAAILLMLPGFLTDIVGLLLFIPPVRDLGWRLLRSRIRVVSQFHGFGPGFRGPGESRRGPTIDLDEDDYSAGPRPDSPWRRLDEQ